MGAVGRRAAWLPKPRDVRDTDKGKLREIGGRNARGLRPLPSGYDSPAAEGPSDESARSAGVRTGLHVACRCLGKG